MHISFIYICISERHKLNTPLRTPDAELTVAVDELAEGRADDGDVYLDKNNKRGVLKNAYPHYI
jgi:hypothetical protein